MKNQCEAITVASTYSASHRCLKKKAGSKVGKQSLCNHHKTAADTRRQLVRA